MMARRQHVVLLAIGALLLAGCAFPDEPVPALPSTSTATVTEIPPFSSPVMIVWSLARWPNVVDHARDAIALGESATCTLDREGAEANREDSLAGVPTAEGMDRDEFPPAVCDEGGMGADVRLVPSSENRSHGAWWGNALEPYVDGTVILIVVEASE
jgi:Deoxyribonuclease NucA/NucB